MDKNKTVKKDHKLILSCTKHGVLNHVYLDTASIIDNNGLPIGLHSIVSPSSINQLGSFWLSIQENAMVGNTILGIKNKNRLLNYIFSGYLLNDTVLLCGKTKSSAAEKALEEIILINNEQANQIRLTEKKVDKLLQEVKKSGLSESLLNDFSAVNNELINNKRELVRQNRKIELLNKELSEVNENLYMFTHSVSHDLREPIRMVKSFLGLLNKKYQDKLDEKGNTYLEFATDGAERLSKMLEGMLEYHQTAKLTNSETIDLNKIIVEVKEILERKIKEKNAKVISEKLPSVKGSAVGYLQVFQNLISNAIKFVREGSTPTVHIKVKENEHAYTISVIDNGIGIQDHKKLEIFDLYTRLHATQKYEGTGMGLAIVRKSIEKMGGQIWLESTLGEGSTFHFTIPKT